MTGSTKEPPFDERAALAELERFRRDIERHRARREAVGQKFDKFIESFPAPEDVFPSEAEPAARAPEPKPAPVLEAMSLPPLPKREVRTPPAATPPAPVADARAAPARVADVQPAPAPPRPSAPVAERPIPSPPIETAPLVPPSMPAAEKDLDFAPAAAIKVAPNNRRTPVFAAVMLILLVVGAFAIWTFRRGATAPEQQPASTPAPAPAQPSAAQPTAPAPAAVESEITTLRRAWVRVIADGGRVVERELPANSRIPFKADKTILVRTGDAGAVKLSIRGKDQGALGRDGQVVTRTFPVPPAPPR